MALFKPKCTGSSLINDLHALTELHGTIPAMPHMIISLLGALSEVWFSPSTGQQCRLEARLHFRVFSSFFSLVFFSRIYFSSFFL